MARSRRSVLFLSAALLLTAACELTPVYGPGGAGAALYGRVEVAAPVDEGTYQLVRELEQRLGRAADPEFDLGLILKTDTEGQAITASGDITRFSIVAEAEYILTERATGTEVASGNVRNFTGYSATGSTVETLAAERDARERLMIILADQITARLFATTMVPK